MVSNSIASARLPVLEDWSMFAEIQIARIGKASQVDDAGQPVEYISAICQIPMATA